MAGHEQLSNDELEAALTSWAGNLAAAEYRWLCLVAEYDRRGSYQAWECKSCAHWLMWHCGLNLRSALEKVRVARALATLPLVSDRFASGHLSYSKVRAITRIATPASEPALVELAEHTHTAALERIVAAYRRVEELSLATSEAALRRSCTLTVEEDGTYTLRARLAPDEGALLAAALNAAAEPDRERSGEQRRADALVAIASRSLAGQGGGSQRDHYQVVVHLEADGAAHIDNGPAVPPETVDRLHCDAPSCTVTEAADGTPLAVSPNRQAVPATLRRAVRSRDRACRFPGCTHHVWVDTHHLTARRDGGPNRLENLLLLCRRHHRAVHEGGWRVEGTTAQPRFRSPAGWYAEPPAHQPAEPDYVGHLGIAAGTITPHWYGDRVELADVVSGLYALNHPSS